MIKQTLTAAALAVVLAGPAFAQAGKSDAMAKPDHATQSQMTKPGAKPGTMAGQHTAFLRNQHATDWRGSKLIGATVYGPDNASIGDINDVLIARNGKINAVVIGVGGFLGVGEKNVAVSFDKLRMTREPESAEIAKITVDYSKNQLKSAPNFAYYRAGAATTTGSAISDTIKSLNPMNDKSDK